MGLADTAAAHHVGDRQAQLLRELARQGVRGRLGPNPLTRRQAQQVPGSRQPREAEPGPEGVRCPRPARDVRDAHLLQRPFIASVRPGLIRQIWAGFLSNLLGWGLPAYFSLRALDTPGTSDDKQWVRRRFCQTTLTRSADVLGRLRSACAHSSACLIWAGLLNLVENLISVT